MVKQEIQATIAPLLHAGSRQHGREEQARWPSNGALRIHGARDNKRALRHVDP